MDDDGAVAGVAEKAANGANSPEKNGEIVTEKKEQTEEVIEEDKKTEAGEIGKDAKVEEAEKSKEEKENREKKDKEDGKDEGKDGRENGHSKDEDVDMEIGSEEIEEVEGKKRNREKVEDKADEPKEEPKEEEKKPEESNEKGPRKRGRGKGSREKVKEQAKEMEDQKEAEQRTPASDRPVRERKSVDRLVASIEKEHVKEFHIEKGRGTPLKDIPNVAFKLSKKKTDGTFRLLHTILFGRRGKAFQIKSNIGRFSGFVWHENEEKQKIKVKEKFDKCNKERLLEFCDVLDIPVVKAAMRKEDIVAKLIDFLVAPHATTTVLLADKEKLSRGVKRKRAFRRSSTTPRGPRSAKTHKKDGSSRVDKTTAETEDDSEEEKTENEENEEENANGVKEHSEDEMSGPSDSEDRSDSDDEYEGTAAKRKRSTKRASKRKESAGRAIGKKVVSSPKAAPSKMHKKSSSQHSSGDDDCDTMPKVSRKNSSEKVNKEKSTSAKSGSLVSEQLGYREKAEKKVLKGKDKKKEKLRPTDDDLRDAICEILKEVDFNTATFTDILKQLAERFDMDLGPRKQSIKLMIQEELTKLAEAEDGDDEDDGDGLKAENHSAGQEVEA